MVARQPLEPAGLGEARLRGADVGDRPVLQRDGRISNVELACEVGLPPSPCLRRVRLLEEAGVIVRYAALLDAAKVGVGLTVFVCVWLTEQDEETVERFVARVREAEQVVGAI